MSIPASHIGKYLFHFTHLENLESILKDGLLSTNLKKQMSIDHFDVAEEGIQERRSRMPVTVGPKGVVHDYVPFYWNTKTPMFLSLVNSKNVDQNFMIFIAIKVDKIIDERVVFTNASANTEVAPDFYSNPTDLDKLPWEEINDTKWSSGSDVKRHKKMAEVLIHNKLLPNEFDIIMVWNKWVKEKVEEIYKRNNIIAPRIEFEKLSGKYLYFTKFMVQGMENHSLVTGPILLKSYFEEAIKEIIKKRNEGQINSPKFKNITDALIKIQNDFCCIPELKGIYMLDTDNQMHHGNVSDHTLEVVKALEDIEYFKKSSPSKKDILKLSAYLHDIGKGPSSKWKNGIQTSYPDHPADAPEMLKRILSEEFEILTEYEVRIICTLVTYHDLIGEVIGKGRNFNQILDLVSTEDEFEMLSCLNLADVTAIGTWLQQSYLASIEETKTRFMKLIKKEND